jgi:hypothetical protein
MIPRIPLSAVFAALGQAPRALQGCRRGIGRGDAREARRRLRTWRKPLP